jgi:hypothetical protein
MKQAIPVEEWAKENLQRYSFDVIRLRQNFDHAFNDSDIDIHHDLCPQPNDHPILQYTYMIKCIENGKLHLLELALKQGLDPNARGVPSRNYCTPLHIAASDYSDAVQLLIDYGADIHAVDRIQWTPLNYTWANPTSTRILLKHGAKRGDTKPYEYNRSHREWIKRVERTMQLLGGAPLPRDIIRHIHTFIK